MKQIFYIAIFFILTAVNSAQNFFPLQVGNIYQIENDWDRFLPGGQWHGGTNYQVCSVVQDSLINGYHFYSLNSPGSYSPFPQNFFFQYDSSAQKLMVKLPMDDTVRLAVDFNAPADSQYISYIYGTPVLCTSGGISPNLVLGDTVLTYQLNGSLSSEENIQYNFADKIGFTYFRYMDIYILYLGYDSRFSTISAIVDSSVFNPFVLSIDSLYPVIDRPVDTFPFILSIPFHASYSAFINSFQLAIEIERDSEVVYNMNYSISISNPHIQINPADLQIGDIIKLKATISDTSIFNNIDIYPDSGWATFRVLDPVPVEDINPLNLKYKLEQNYPNPFNPVTIITYEIPEKTYVLLKIYDILGNEVTNLVNREMPAGNYNVEFDGEKLSSGVYICRFRTSKFTKSTKMILAK